METNIHSYKLDELTKKIDQLIKGKFDMPIKVSGEVSYKEGKIRASSGHLYFDLQDEDSSLKVVCFRSAAQNWQSLPKNGEKIVVYGQIRVYRKGSNYQLIATSYELEGIGEILRRQNELRQKLAKEGLFDQDRKQELKMLPKAIGLITSKSGAVISDFCNKLNEVCPRNVYFIDVPVQGVFAKTKIAYAIEEFNLAKETNLIDLDVIVIARGGGSVNDLEAFSEEVVIRAASASKLPIVSAIGHDQDQPILDLVADVRAATPTDAVNKVVINRKQTIAAINQMVTNITNSVRGYFSQSKSKHGIITSELWQKIKKVFLLKLSLLRQTGLDFNSVTLDQIKNKQQTLIRYLDAIQNFKLNIANKIKHNKQNLASINYSEILTKIQNKSNLSDQILNRIIVDDIKNITSKKKHIDNLINLVEATSHFKILKRGYLLARDNKGRLIKQSSNLKVDDILELLWSDNFNQEPIFVQVIKNPNKI